MSRRLRKACKNVIGISQQEGMNFSELQKFLRELNNEMKAQKCEDSVNRTAEEKAFKKKAEHFLELNESEIKSQNPSVRNNYKVKYTELLCVYFANRKEIDSERNLLLMTAWRFQIRTNSIKKYLPGLKKILTEFFKKVPEIEKFGTLELLDYTVKYIEDYL